MKIGAIQSEIDMFKARVNPYFYGSSPNKTQLAGSRRILQRLLVVRFGYFFPGKANKKTPSVKILAGLQFLSGGLEKSYSGISRLLNYATQ